MDQSHSNPANSNSADSNPSDTSSGSSPGNANSSANPGKRGAVSIFQQIIQKKYNPLYDEATNDLPIDPKVQEEIINKPQVDPQAFSEEDETFLQHVIQLIESKKIQLYLPSSLLNPELYAKLTPETQGKIDMEAFNILASIRQIHGLYMLGHTHTYQIKNLVHLVRLQKERTEGIQGDVFII